MTQKGFYIDTTRCAGCRTCSVACADLNNTPVGLNLRRVVEYEGGEWKKNWDGTWRQNVFAYYVSMGCNECADPACVKVCPTKAHYKRAEDGLVVIDTAKCIGCGACAAACPYGAPQLDKVAKKCVSATGASPARPRAVSPCAWKAARNARSNSATSKSCVASTERSQRLRRCLLRKKRIRASSSNLVSVQSPSISKAGKNTASDLTDVV